jgi:hypothetical protein
LKSRRNSNTVQISTARTVTVATLAYPALGSRATPEISLEVQVKVYLSGLGFLHKDIQFLRVHNR